MLYCTDFSQCHVRQQVQESDEDKDDDPNCLLPIPHTLIRTHSFTLSQGSFCFLPVRGMLSALLYRFLTVRSEASIAESTEEEEDGDDAVGGG